MKISLQRALGEVVIKTNQAQSKQLQSCQHTTQLSKISDEHKDSDLYLLNKSTAWDIQWKKQYEKENIVSEY